jgi:UV DNA damage repair endonuclease
MSSNQCSSSAAFSPVQIPICVDYFHHQCYGEAEFDIYDPALTARIMKVWQDRGMKPKCHISEQVSLRKFQSLIPLWLHSCGAFSQFSAQAQTHVAK